MDNATTQAYNFVQRFNEVILFPTIALLSAVALLVFMYGCFLYIVRAADPAARTQGIQHITWGIVGMVVMLSAYTIMSIAAGTFGLRDALDAARDGNIVNPLPVGGGSLDDGAAAGGGSLDDSIDSAGGSLD
jgi:hypothetical protein